MLANVSVNAQSEDNPLVFERNNIRAINKEKRNEK